MLPTLLLVLRSVAAIRIVVVTAVGGLSYLAGESLARALPKPAVATLLGVSVLGVAAAIPLGLLEQGESLAVNLGKLAAAVVALGVPGRAFIAQRGSGNERSNVNSES
jgi:hypothetical protein